MAQQRGLGLPETNTTKMVPVLILVMSPMNGWKKTFGLKGRLVNTILNTCSSWKGIHLPFWV